MELKVASQGQREMALRLIQRWKRKWESTRRHSYGRFRAHIWICFVFTEPFSVSTIGFWNAFSTHVVIVLTTGWQFRSRTAGTAKRTKLNIGTTSNLKNLWAGRSAVQTVLICSHAKATQNTSASEVPVREEQKKIKEGRREGFETFDQSYQVSQLS